MTVRHTRVETTIGALLLVADDDAVTGVYFPGRWYPPAAGSIGPEVTLADDALLAQAGQELVEFLAGRRRDFTVATATSGNPLQERVWALLREIPYGTTTTYGAIAETLGDRALAQAVGQAVGHNPVSILIPCHRVVGSSGKLTGFAGGLERKRFLLELEEPVGAEPRLF